MANKLQYLVIHCTDTPAGREVTSDDIRHWHTDPVSKGGRGWKQVGYTDMFHLDGRRERLVRNNEDAYVDGWEITNGVAGYNSKEYVLNFHKRFPSVKIVGHNQLAAKECPCFNVPAWLKEIGIK